MGYWTELKGSFKLDRKLSEPEHIYLEAFNKTRHFKRNVEKLGFPKDYFGQEGEFYIYYPSDIVKKLSKCIVDENDPLYKYYTFPRDVDQGILSGILNTYIERKNWAEHGIIDWNMPAGSCPSLYCPWTPSKDGMEIIPDGSDKPYEYTKWLFFICRNFLEPKKHILNGIVKWQGEEPDDFGQIEIINNEIRIYQGVKDYQIMSQEQIESKFGVTQVGS